MRYYDFALAPNPRRVNLFCFIVNSGYVFFPASP